MIKDNITIYTDGSIRRYNGVRKGGYGIIIAKGREIKYYAAPILGLGSSYAELYAMIITLRSLLKDGLQDHNITINTDFLPVKTQFHGMITHWERTKPNGYKMRPFWLEFDRLSKQFSNLSLRWVSRNDGDVFNQMADELASKGAEVKLKDVEHLDLDIEDISLLSSSNSKLVFVTGDKKYQDYDRVRQSLDDAVLSHGDVIFVTDNNPGAAGYTEFYCQEKKIPLVRVLNENEMTKDEYYQKISECDYFSDKLHFSSKKETTRSGFDWIDY